MLVTSKNIIPVPIFAPSEMELSMAMKRINDESGRKHHFFDIQQDLRTGEWVAWYETDATQLTSKQKQEFTNRALDSFRNGIF